MSSRRFLAPCCLLLPIAVAVGPRVGAQDALTPEERSAIAAELLEEDRDVPVQRELQVPCPRIDHLEIHSRTGDVVAMGEGGYMAGLVSDREPIPWPTLVRESVLAAIFENGPEGLPAHIFLGTADGLVRRFARGATTPDHTYPEDAMWAERTIRAMALAPDGALLAVVGESPRVRLYDVESGAERKPFLGDAPLKGLAFLPDGRIVCGDAAGKLHLFEAADPSSVTSLPAHEAAVTGCAVHGRVLFSASVDGELRSLDLGTGKVLQTARPLEGPIDIFRFATDPYREPRILLASARGTVALVDGASFEVVVRAPIEEPGLTAANLDGYARFLTVAYAGGKVVQWHVDKLRRGEMSSLVDGRPLRFDPTDYAAEAGRLGMKLEKTESGFRVLGYLLGAMRNPERGPAPGDVVTHVRVGEEWIELRDPERDLPPNLESIEPLAVRYESRARQKTREDEVALYYDGTSLLDEVAAVAAGDPGYDLGIEFSWRGHVHRLDPAGAGAAAGLRVGDRIQLGQMGNEEAFEGAQEAIRAGQPLMIEVERPGEARRQIEVRPQRRSKAYRLAQLSALFHRAGYTDHAAELAQQARDEDPGDYRLYLALASELRSGTEVAETLEQGILQARHRLPLVETLVRLRMDRLEEDAARELIRKWDDPAAPDHKLAILRARLQSMSEDRAVLESLLPSVQAAADALDPEAFTPAMILLDRLGRPDEARRYRRLLEAYDRFPPPPGYPERPTL